MKAIKKVLVGLVAVLTTSSATSVYAFADTTYTYKETTGYTVNVAYISCFQQSMRINTRVQGSIWTRTSNNEDSPLNTSESYYGYVFASVNAQGVSGGQSEHTYAASAGKTYSISGFTSNTSVASVHIFNSDYYGHASKVLITNSDD